MKEFNLSGSVTISVYTTVEAETLEQAIEIAESRSIKSYAFVDDRLHLHNWVNDEYDGEVQDIEES